MRSVALVCLLICAPRGAIAQTLNGGADWGYGRSTYRTADTETETGSFTQGYTIGYNSALWDPRFVTYSGELTFNRNALTFGSEASGAQQTGFNGAASLFSSRPFRVSLHGSRSFGGVTGNYPESPIALSGLSLPPGSTPELRTGRSDFGINWLLNARSLPRVEMTYQQGSNDVAAGPLQSVQQQQSLHALVAREGPRLSNTLRYERNASDNDVSLALRQRYSEIAYELAAKPNDRTRADVRAGRRTTSSLFDAPPQTTSGDAYRPPSTGEINMYYGWATVAHMPNARFSTDVNIGYNGERSAAAATTAALGAGTARFHPVAGATLRGTGTFGQRGQEIAGAHRDILTRTAGGGAEYTTKVKSVRLGGAYEAERGWNRSDLNVDGASRLWRARVDGAVDALGIAQLSAGYDRSRSIDDLLTLGNQWQERTHGAVRSAVTSRVTIDGSCELVTLDRGVSPQLFRTRYTQATTTATIQLTRQRRAALIAGRFVNRSSASDEANQYFGASFDGTIAGVLRMTATLRREHTTSTAAHLDQAGYYTTSAIEYRLRLFTFTLDYRYTDLALSTANQTDPLTFTGNQILFRVGRKFGVGR